MKLWREIFESLPDALILLSASYAPLASNPAAETLLAAMSTPALSTA
jgi:hypothetical protein